MRRLSGAGFAELRIAAVSPFVDRRHGTERAFAELLERLAATYHCEIHLYAERVEDLAVAPRDADPKQRSGAIYWHKVPSIPGPHILQFIVWIFLNGLLRWVDFFFRRRTFDLVLSPGINCLDADVVIVHAVFRRLREAAEERKAGDSASVGLFRRLHRRTYYWLLTWFERRIYTDPKVSLAAVSQRTAGLLAQYFQPQDLRVIPNGVDTVQFSPEARRALRESARQRRSFRDEDFTLLLIGNDWRMKGVGTILRAMAAMPDLPFKLLVGGSDVSSHFRERAKELGLGDRCQWEPPRPDVIDFYAAADAYVSPTLEDSFGLPVLEAMACGLPIITSICAGVSGMIGDGIDGFVLSDPSDAVSLSRLLREIYADADLRRRVAGAAVQAAHRWTWDRNAEGVWQLLQDTAKRNRVIGQGQPDPESTGIGN